MRTIGKKWKEQIKKMAKEIGSLEGVREALPSALWDSCEMADQEINEIIMGVIENDNGKSKTINS